ncbi:MAG: Rrf2 family transcriptional regulator [Dehalococcoidales bacterium]|nr:Rrf2 family transcriptional regulator [Dehalococcoidales bacterium]
MDKKVFLIKSDTDYAMRMLVCLALQRESVPVTAAVLVEGQDIPVDFAYKILQKLRRVKIIESFKGVNGGFLLAREPDKISLLEVIEAVQGRIVIRPCLLDDDNCVTAKPCPVSYKLQKLQEILDSEMQGITLAQIIQVKQSIC